MTSKILFEPYSEEFARDPYATYRSLREAQPIYYYEDWDLYLLSRYEDIAALVNDPRLVRTLDHVTSQEEVMARREAEGWGDTPRLSRFVRINILDSEGEYHDRLRKLVYRIFTPLRVSSLREFVQSHVDQCINDIEKQGAFDFIEDFAARIPGHVIGALLGVPIPERPRLRGWTEDIVQFFEPERSPEQIQLAEDTTIELADYLVYLFDIRRKDPQDDLISELVAAEGAGKLDRDELISTCIILLGGGHGSTIDVSGNGMLALLQNPEQKMLLGNDLSNMQTAIQEMFRYDSPLPYFHRYALEDIEYKGVTYKKGTKFGILYGSANRDPEQFEKPDSFDIQRDPNRHLAFGIGAHFCLGNHLARLNMDIMFSALLKRLPEISLVDDEPEFRVGLTSRGLKALRVQC